MVRNVRWLYSKLGTEDFSVTGQSTVSGALSGLNSELGNKSNTSHTHNTDTLPVSNNQVNSTSYVPTSALLYSMKDRADGIQSIIAAAKRVLDDPNKRYESKDLGTWGNSQAADTFLSTYTHENNYEGLSLGNYVTIQDGTYNVDWEIAGFDMECGQLAADDTVYDNGYGICMIPKTEAVTSGKWNTTNDTTGGYKSSYMHNTVLPGIVNTLKNVLGDHIVSRNVLLSSSVTDGTPSAYTWTTADATLMSIGQMTGTFASNSNKYDDGEANYKLPLFNNKDFVTGLEFWFRGVHGKSFAWVVTSTGRIDSYITSYKVGIRPLIYLR